MTSDAQTMTDEAAVGTADQQALFVPVENAGSLLGEGVVGSDQREVWMPTGYSTGPWSPDSLHGGPVAALFVRAAERVDAPEPVRLARVTIELFAPVPFVPLVVDARVIRPGKKISTLELDLREATGDASVDTRVLATARVQRIRTTELRFPDGAADHVPDLPEESTPIIHWPGSAEVTFHADAVEHRFVFGSFSEPGPSMNWMRLAVPVVPGETPTGWQRAAAFADFTNGLSSVAPFDGTSMFINPDLTVSLWREPVGEWICSHAETRTSDSGIGMSHALLWDAEGRVGIGTQSLFLDR